jgi:hypothetical protein
MLTRIFLALLLITPAPGIAQQSTAKYDRFKDITTHEADIQLSKSSKTAPSIYFNLAAKVAGTRAIIPTDELLLDALLLFDMSSNPMCLGTSVEVLADNNRFSIETSYPTESRDDFAVSFFAKHFSYDDALEFVNSQSIEARICGSEYRFTDDQIAKLRSIFQAPQSVHTPAQPHTDVTTSTSPKHVDSDDIHRTAKQVSSAPIEATP